MNIPRKQPFEKIIKAPFGVPNPQQEPTRAKTVHTASRPQHTAQPYGSGTAINTFASVLTPMITKLPVKALPDYKPFVDTGLELARNAVEDSGVKAYCSFESFKCYFNITNLYVLRKLMLVIAPYTDLVLFL